MDIWKKKSLLIFILLIILVVTGFVLFKSYNNNKNEVAKDEPIKDETNKDEPSDEMNSYEFKTQLGEDVIIKADKLVTATGFTGSSFYHFYLLGNTLYLKNTSNLENEEQVIAYNIKDIGEEKYDIYAIEDDNTIIVNQTNYITFKKEN